MREDKECEKVTTRWLKIMGCVHRKNRKLMFGYILLLRTSWGFLRTESKVGCAEEIGK